jgi:hypothetical protein
MTAAPVPPFPTGPDEMPDPTVDELFNAYERHLFAVVAVRNGEAADLLAAHAVAALAIGQAIVDTFAAERWFLVRDGLAGGVTAEDVGIALGGLEVDEVSAGLGLVGGPAVPGRRVHVGRVQRCARPGSGRCALSVPKLDLGDVLRCPVSPACTICGADDDLVVYARRDACRGGVHDVARRVCGQADTTADRVVDGGDPRRG